jgi:hypothetical protein
MGRRLADEQEMSARRLHRLADRLAGVEVVAEIDGIEPGIAWAMGNEPASRRPALAILLVVPILRHDKLGLQRHHSIVPPLRLRVEQQGQCSFAERKYSVPSNAISTWCPSRRKAVSPSRRSKTSTACPNSGWKHSGLMGSNISRI